MNNNIVYLGYFILNSKHKNGGSEHSVQMYINSIIKFINVLNDKIVVLYLDKNTYERIINNVKINNNIHINIVNYEEYDLYKILNSKFQEHLKINDFQISSFVTHNDEESKKNIMNTLIIWFIKFEIIKKCKDYIYKYQKNGLYTNITHIIYIDVGIFRDDRYKFIEDWHMSDFSFKTLNKIMINCKNDCTLTNDYYEQNINKLFDLLKKGDYEISCNHFGVSLDIIDKVFETTINKIDFILNKYNIITTEQRIFKLVILDFYLENKNDISMYRNKNNCSYTIDFHNEPIN
jgi:hypothetical protein